MPHAVGAAYAARVKNEDSVAVCWFGDGAASEGGVHEAMNLAGVHKLPVVFLCENNGYAISVPLAQQMPITTMEARAAAYGFAGTSVDGCDAEAVHEATTTAIARARSGDGPTIIDMQRAPHRPSLVAGRRLVPRRRPEGRRRRTRPDPAAPRPAHRAAARSTPRRTKSTARRSRPTCSRPPSRPSRNPNPRPIAPGSTSRRWLSADG